MPVGQTAALVTALSLATAIAQPTAGKAAEVLGPRRVFLAGVFLVGVFAAAGNQTALYSQAPAEQLGTASGLLRTFGYVGSIASSAITGIVFHASVSDSGVHLIGWIMTGVSVVLILISVLDRTLPRKTGSWLTLSCIK